MMDTDYILKVLAHAKKESFDDYYRAADSDTAKSMVLCNALFIYLEHAIRAVNEEMAQPTEKDKIKL